MLIWGPIMTEPVRFQGSKTVHFYVVEPSRKKLKVEALKIPRFDFSMCNGFISLKIGHVLLCR